MPSDDLGEVGGKALRGVGAVYLRKELCSERGESRNVEARKHQRFVLRFQRGGETQRSRVETERAGIVELPLSHQPVAHIQHRRRRE